MEPGTGHPADAPLPDDAPAWATILAAKIDRLDGLVRPLVTKYRHLLDRLDERPIVGRVMRRAGNGRA